MTYSIEASTNLTAWSGIASKIGAAAWTMSNGVGVSDAGAGPVTVTDPVLIPANAPRFLRLKITQ